MSNQESTSLGVLDIVMKKSSNVIVDGSVLYEALRQENNVLVPNEYLHGVDGKDLTVYRKVEGKDSVLDKVDFQIYKLRVADKVLDVAIDKGLDIDIQEDHITLEDKGKVYLTINFQDEYKVSDEVNSFKEAIAYKLDLVTFHKQLESFFGNVELIEIRGVQTRVLSGVERLYRLVKDILNETHVRELGKLFNQTAVLVRTQDFDFKILTYAYASSVKVHVKRINEKIHTVRGCCRRMDRLEGMLEEGVVKLIHNFLSIHRQTKNNRKLHWKKTSYGTPQWMDVGFNRVNTYSFDNYEHIAKSKWKKQVG